MIVVGVIIVAMIVMCGAGVRVSMTVIVMPMTTMIMRMTHLVAAWIALVRAIQRDRACDERADQRQKDDGLNHNDVPKRSPAAQSIACPLLILLSMI